jgi:nucleolar protein 56
MYLITKWFGTFLIDHNSIQNYILFPKNKKTLTNKLTKIKNQEILPEEKKLAKNHTDLIINEQRLKPIGTYQPVDPQFTTITITPDQYNYPHILLHDIIQNITQTAVQTKLKAQDLQIIQMVNTLDDLIQTANLLQERLTRWTALPTPEHHLKPLTTTITTVTKEIKTLQNQIETHITTIAPNLTTITGPLIGARLLAQAGSLKKLAMYPASTIQILGAEKALFRYKKDGGKPPKHGIIYQHTSINTAPRKDRGRIARQMATKIAIAIKADYFTKRDIATTLKNDFQKQLKHQKKQHHNKDQL